MDFISKVGGFSQSSERLEMFENITRRSSIFIQIETEREAT
jgi:hypothetical protein